MWIILRTICGALGLAILTGTVVVALELLGMERGLDVLLAAYMCIGGILLGAYLLFYAFTGKWQPQPATSREQRQGSRDG